MKRYLFYRKISGEFTRIGTSLLEGDLMITDKPMDEILGSTDFAISEDGSSDNMIEITGFSEELYPVAGVPVPSLSPYVYRVELE